ncbi:type II toxin-antitoxin system PemK/MazF family toxin [Nostoc sp. FACHB-280]|uniref:type II toxin-antitoxin system PemK/MazF family toxin n=1 Tax=Nostoc sp. FACHB-280 TaxID=2692839 RepID=UPI00168BE3CD|nr:type II toxin-antitoxin system PemK/MazF family toxin [Nostoc sp. FACHB-280]MBD2496458.1 type II toxin-antitoxin system PemK/MazF family toxin [Nostoc sp. FACHB-280]
MTFNPGDVITVDFPGVTGVKRRPAVVLSSATYHTIRPDVIIGLITTQTTSLVITDYTLQDWSLAGLRVASIFRSFIVTLPPSANLVLIGHLSERDWKGVCACVKIALADLDNSHL